MNTYSFEGYVMNTYENVDQSRPHTLKSRIKIKIGRKYLSGQLSLSTHTKNIVLILQQNSDGSDKSGNQHIANSLHAAGMSTLLIDLLTDDEQKKDSQSYCFRFDSELLAKRLVQVTNWVQTHPVLAGSKITYFSTGINVAPALVAATILKNQLNAVITNKGRPDLVENVLAEVKCPALLIVPHSDKVVLKLNKLAYKKMKCKKNIKFVNAKANDLKEPSELVEIAQAVSVWLDQQDNNKIKWN